MKQTNSSVSKYLFLVVVFFIPLTSNLLHYVVIEHEYGLRNHVLEWIDGSKVHYCDQYLFKIHPAVEVPTFAIAIVPLVINAVVIDVINVRIKQPSHFFYFNRGPPFV